MNIALCSILSTFANWAVHMKEVYHIHLFRSKKTEMLYLCIDRWVYWPYGQWHFGWWRHWPDRLFLCYSQQQRFWCRPCCGKLPAVLFSVLLLIKCFNYCAILCTSPGYRLNVLILLWLVWVFHFSSFSLYFLFHCSVLHLDLVIHTLVLLLTKKTYFKII